MVKVITGPTGSGKTDVAFQWARRMKGRELICADSLTIYRGLDIGTAKPSPEMRSLVPHHLLDIKEPNVSFSAADFRKLALQKITEIGERGGEALVVGGSGFYIKALVYGMWDAPGTDSKYRIQLEGRETSDLYQELRRRDPSCEVPASDRYRIIRALEIAVGSGKSISGIATSRDSTKVDFTIFVVDRPNDDLFSRIESRTKKMIDAGLVNETRWLIANFPDSPCLKAVGYRQCVAYLKGETPRGRKPIKDLAGLSDEIVLATRQLVKRQRTWFRGQFKNAETLDVNNDVSFFR